MAKLVLDESKMARIIERHMIMGLERAVVELVDIMEREVLMTVHGNGPGRSAWRQAMSDNMGVVQRNMTPDFQEVHVGYTAASNMANHMKALIITEGSGSQARDGGWPIMAGPYGRTVWTHDMGIKKSEVSGTYALPEEFNQMGNDWMNNSMERIRNRFFKIMRDAWDSIPSSEMQSCVQWR